MKYYMQFTNGKNHWCDWGVEVPYEEGQNYLKELTDRYTDYKFRLIGREIIQTFIAGSSYLDQKELNDRDQFMERQWEER